MAHSNIRSLALAKARLERLQEEIDFRELIEGVEFAQGEVIRFAIKYGATYYNYAAIHLYIGRDDARWFVTGRGNEGQYLTTGSFIQEYLLKAEFSSIKVASGWISLLESKKAQEDAAKAIDDQFVDLADVDLAGIFNAFFGRAADQEIRDVDADEKAQREQ